MVTTSTPRHGASPPAQLIEAVVMLRKPEDTLPGATECHQLARSVLDQAGEETGLQAEATKVFENLNAFSVRASSEFVNAIARSANVAEVLPNDTGPELIEPVRRTDISSG